MFYLSTINGLSIFIRFVVVLGTCLTAVAMAEPPRYELVRIYAQLPPGNSWISGHDSYGRFLGVHSEAGSFTWSEAEGIKFLRGAGTAYGINDRGQMVGAHLSQPIIWDRGAPAKELNIGDASTGLAYQINNNSIAVGYVTGPGWLNAALWESDKNTFSVLDIFGVRSVASSINNHDVVVGRTEVPCGSYRTRTAFLWYAHAAHDLGFPAWATGSAANAINDNFQIVGHLRVDRCSFPTAMNANKAALFENGEWYKLHTDERYPYSDASAINNRGDVVGQLLEQGGENSGELFISPAPPLWLPRQERRMYSLRDYISRLESNAILLTATAINDAGWIGGSGFFNFEPREKAFVLIPQRAEN